MTNPTNPFNWQMPTASDLVTDLPADFETFGQAVATSMADLLGGTTGQVLSKASNTDMDFTWVTSDDANAIQNAIVDAKGDLIAASAADTPARLAVGNNGETLVADSTTSTGLRWQAPTNVNPILNSAMQIWQRGTSPTWIANNSQNYQMDRWIVYSADSGRTVTRQTTGDTTNLPFIQYCARVQRTNGNTATGFISPYQPMESINSIPFAGKTVTMSFYARRGANYSASSNALTFRLITGTGTDENVIYPGYTGNVTAIDQTATLTTTWQRFSYTATLNSTITEMTPQFIYQPVGTAGAADFFEFTGVQIEVGSVATPFKTNGTTFQSELQACLRYYQRQLVASSRMCMGFSSSTSAGQFVIGFPAAMRTVPSSMEYGGTIVWFDGVTGNGIGTMTLVNASTVSAGISFTGSSGLTQYRPLGLSGNSSDAYLAFNAEL